MNAAVLAPPPECLALVVEENPEQTPKRYQRAVCHDRFDKPKQKVSVQASHGVERIATYPSSSAQTVMNLLNPYPQTFLFTVTLTIKLPATGL